MSSRRRKREKQQKLQERLKDKQARAARMNNPTGGSEYAKKGWNKDGSANDPEQTIKRW